MWTLLRTPAPPGEGPMLLCEVSEGCLRYEARAAPFSARVAKVAGESGVARMYRHVPPAAFATHRKRVRRTPSRGSPGDGRPPSPWSCLLYTSDAADE